MAKKAEVRDFRSMTADTIGKDILAALVTEVKLLPDVWPKMNKKKQDDVIDRLRKCVEHGVSMAVHIIASDDRTVVAGVLEKVTIKGSVEAVIKFGQHAGNLDGLYQVASGEDSKEVLVVVANPNVHTGGMDEIQGEDDQRNIDLGHEYHDDDGGGMDNENIVDAEQLPASVITQEDLDNFYNMGYDAAEEGKEQSDCPMVASDLVAKWVRGWKDFHEQNSSDDDGENNGNSSIPEIE